MTTVPILTDQALQPDRRRPEPLWHQAEQTMRALISRGDWPLDGQIPAEDRLCGMLGISRITVRHALRNLEEAGLLRREHGRGTFVCSPTVVAGTRGLTSFTDEMGNLGLVVGSHVLDQAIVPAAAEVAEALEVDLGTPVARIRRLRLGNDIPMGTQTAHLLSSRVPGLLDQPLKASASLYQTLEARYGLKAIEAREVYRVALVGETDAALLRVPATSPAFVVERISRDAKGIFEFTVSLMRGDRYEIRSTLYL